MKKITYLSGGVGGARFSSALSRWNDHAGSPCELTAIVNVGDDFTHLGLHISPDIDSVTYHLSGLGDAKRGWGRANDTDCVAQEVARIMPETTWFQLGDLDIAHNLMRTHLLSQGLTLSEVTETLAQKYGVPVNILPATNDPSPTTVLLPRDEQEVDSEHPVRRNFQEWWVKQQAEPLPLGFEFPGATRATPAPGVIEAITDADLIVFAPSNPVVSIDPILAIPGIREALATSNAPVIGLSPIIGNKPVRGWADRCLQAVGISCTAGAVTDYYGHSSTGGLLDGWLIDPVDEDQEMNFAGIVSSVPLLFTQDENDFPIIDLLIDMPLQA